MQPTGYLPSAMAREIIHQIEVCRMTRGTRSPRSADQ